MEQTISSRTFRDSDSISASETNTSGVSWSAVLGGAFVTAALALILLALGTGLGLSSVSLLGNAGASTKTIGVAAIIWLIVMEIISSSMGGYLAGRLRTKWATIHSDEVYFRDTAHGFLAWAVALVITAAFLGTAATSLMGSAEAGKNTSTTRAESTDAYFVDTLFRTDGTKNEALPAATHSEAAAIMANAIHQGTLSPADRSYLAQLISSRTGLTQADAEKRVDATYTSAVQTAEDARKALAHTLLWTFLALLIGAFCASLSATIGGRQRDHVVSI